MTHRRPWVVESYRDGSVWYDVTRMSWEELGVHSRPVVVATFLTRADADRWIESTEARQAELGRAHGATR